MVGQLQEEREVFRGLFNDAFIIETIQCRRTVMNDELGKTWKELFTDHFKVLSQCLL
jgi:hypothetical protein